MVSCRSDHRFSRKFKIVLIIFQDVKHDPTLRRRVETTIGQLVKYFDIEHVNCRDLWHLTSRMGRKLLGLTVGAFLNISSGRDAMQFESMLDI